MRGTQHQAAHDVFDMDEVAAAAASQGLGLEEFVPMPANNFSMIFRRG
jgi:hypothetical protein